MPYCCQNRILCIDAHWKDVNPVTKTELDKPSITGFSNVGTTEKISITRITPSDANNQFVRREQHPQSGGRDVLQLAEIQRQGVDGIQGFFDFRFQIGGGHGVQTALQGKGQGIIFLLLGTVIFPVY